MKFRKKNLMKLDDDIIASINSNKQSEDIMEDDEEEFQPEDFSKRKNPFGDNPTREEVLAQLMLIAKHDTEEQCEAKLEEKDEECETKLKEKDEECAAKIKEKDDKIEMYKQIVRFYQASFCRIAGIFAESMRNPKKEIGKELNAEIEILNKDLQPYLHEIPYINPYEMTNDPMGKYWYGWLYGGYDDWKRKHPNG